MWIHRHQMSLLCSIVIMILLVSHGKSEKDIAESVKSVKVQYLSRKSIGTILETFGAIKTIGKYLIDFKNGTTDNRLNNPQNSADGAANVETISPEPDLSSVVFTISKKVFGQNITEKLVESLVNLSHGKVSPDNRVCTTPSGSEGYCDDYKNCPQLNLDLLADSICFRNMFNSGVCCPKETSEPQRDESLDPKRLEPQITVNSPPNTKQLTLTTLPEYTTSYIQKPIQQLSKNTKIYSGCGRPEVPKFRVVGGVEALPGRWPWMAAIFIQNVYACGGTLIGSKHILTAAHCTKNNIQIPFKARQFSVILGDLDLIRNDEPSSPKKYFVVDVRAHRKFATFRTKNSMLLNDIAILILDRPVTHNKYIMPLCLPPESLKSETFIGQSSTIVGWGSIDYGGVESTVQRQVSLPVWSNKDCERIYHPFYVEENLICAGLIKGGKDSCHGDSGGPLMLKKDGRWMQIGIVSFGEKCGEPRSPGVYTRVTGYLDWIKKNMI